MISCRTLGPVEILVDGGAPPPELLWRKNLALLVYLARSPRHLRTREHLIGLLWADKPETAARHSLREAVRILRRCLGDSGVLHEGAQIGLEPGTIDLDTDRFDALTSAGDWRGAADLVGGEFLEGFSVPDASTFEDWLTAERATWRGRSVDALVRRAEELVRVGQPLDAVAAANFALSLDRTSETAARTVMRSHALTGNRSAALETYAALAARLDQELGTEPDGETQALADRVRRERTWRVAEPAPHRVGAESRRAPLVGREAELGHLLDAWDAARRSRQPGVGLVEGETGMGITRLVDEVVVRARLDGAATSTVRAVEADRKEPWSGVLGLARGGLLDAPGLAAAPPAALAAFAARAAEWADRFGDAVRGETPLPMGRALSEVLRAVADEQAVLLAADDAQWLDHDSLLALRAALRDLADAPIFLLFAATPRPPRDELDEMRARLGRDLDGANVLLQPLDAAALRALARWAIPAYGDEQLDRVARRIAADSAGLPLLAVELLHAVALGHDLLGAERVWPEPLKTFEHSYPGELPSAVIAAIRVGYRRLSANAQAMLTVASVLGDRVAPDALTRGSGLDPEPAAAALDELEWQRWLTAEPRGYAFVARIVRDIVARDMVTPGQRQRIKERAASA